MKNNFINGKGFTMIELVITIAIIGALASIIMMHFSNYTNKSKDATIRSEVDRFQLTAAEFFLQKKKYSNLCEAEANPQGRDILEKFENEECHSDAERWVLCVPLYSSQTAWCVDSAGLKQEISQDDCEDIISEKSCSETRGGGGGGGDGKGKK